MAALSTTLLAAAVGIQAISTISSSVNQAATQKLEGKIESQRLETNVKIAELQAKDAEIRGKQESDEYKTRVKQLIGRQRAAFAAQGIDPGFGSALEIQEETAEIGAANALTIRNNAFRDATGYRIQAIDIGGQAQFARFSGENRARNTLITGGLKTITDITEGSGQIASLKGK